MFFIVYSFKGQVHAFAGQIKNCKSLILQDKSNFEIYLSPVWAFKKAFVLNGQAKVPKSHVLAHFIFHR